MEQALAVVATAMAAAASDDVVVASIIDAGGDAELSEQRTSHVI